MTACDNVVAAEINGNRSCFEGSNSTIFFVACVLDGCQLLNRKNFHLREDHILEELLCHFNQPIIKML